ncbi:hydroxylamine reductase [Clostridium botulinum]|uniref:Hydroxylamine reductase n=1 Tax=Clostridium botulinum TaxID=1491 RepID=A0A9Q1V1B7_CLOBO|nr:hydroxylamine reductase [Clostridium botulinum]AEB76990.1 hybrid cluster protein [Clostridium botulinum BKT015925]KEH98423.1 hydroxylamine reductase [Clostridium botulinum D str. 16868]KEI04489.1 hydroxylamine reductase [Clostridium botulinum C/D str. Sp77]KLU75436.1 hydroxylamine reductase [Clostridium botulinum V891]KOA76292.1 hydroxylamine reductase [Clostridium botulinum]
MSMFCYQCQETAGCKGCSMVGVCGKTSDVANLQDLLIYIVKGIAIYDLKSEKSGIKNREVNKFVMDSLFSTITNANFNREDFIVRIKNALELRETIKEKLIKNNVQIDDIKDDCALWIANSVDEFKVKAPTVGILSTENEDVRSLRELLTYGIKGMAAYAHHAYNLGYEDESIYTFMKKALVSTRKALSVDEMIKIVLECGKFGVDVMALLDKANTETYGNPEITKVNIGVRNNPAILISGHDLKDMEELLKQTEGTGVDVYTHSEMLPANYYPAFKKYNHFVGNYGNAWWNQNEEFESFNGPILMTTNCLVPPKESYKRRVYTTGAVSFNGVNHIEDRRDGEGKDFSEIIEHAKKCAPPIEIEKGEIIGGFAHNAVLSLADKIVDAVKKGDIKRFFVMAGCDGRAKTRNYYSDFAKALPQDTVILTAGCAKYKYNKLNLGDIDGIPRVLDAGQCNDSYSLAVIALKLKEVFELDDINKLPISFNISWYEQKAVIVLLALLHLGVKNIHLGPTLPAFLSPNVTKVLVNNFGIAGIGTVDEDIKLFLGEV